MKLDPATLGLAAVLLLAVVGVLLLLSWQVNRKRQALAWWGAAFVTAAGGIAFVGPTRAEPVGGMLLVGNSLVAVAYGLQYTGFRAFNGRPLAPAIAAAGTVAWLVAWPFIGGWFEARLLLMSLVATAYNLLSAHELWRHARERLTTQRAALVLLIVSAVLNFTRGILRFLPAPLSQLDFVTTRWSAGLGLFLVLYVPSLAFVFLSLSKERAEREVRDAAERNRENEARYRALVEASSAIFWRASPSGHIIRADGWSALTGQETDADPGHGWLDFIHPEDRAGVVARWRAVRDSGEGAAHRYRVRTRDGSYRWMNARTVPLRDPDGTIREWVGTLSDIHNETVAAEALARGEERYRLAAMAVSGVVWDRDLVGGRIHWAEGDPGIFGYSPEAIDPSPDWWIDRIHPDDRGRVTAGLAAAIAGDASTWTDEYRFRRADGHHIEVLDRGFMMRDPTGRPLRMVGAVQDLSERLRLEAQLRQAQKMEAVGQLTGGIAHDFNNLLMIILGHAEGMAGNPALPAAARAQAKSILDAGTRGAELTRHLLSFGRRQSLRPEPLDLEEVIAGMRPILDRALGAEIELNLSFAPGLPRALTDRALLESALLNLAVNARDAMPKGGTLTIATGEAPEGEGSLLPSRRAAVSVTVSDTGSGMTPEVAERAFEPFFTTKDVGKGSGLGLSMVYGFAQQSGGHVSIESGLGRGAAVTILLLATGRHAEAALPPPARPAPPPQPAAVAPEPASRERILVVEDEPQVLKFVHSQLTSLAYEVTAVSNAPDALGLLSTEGSFDLLFTDVVLPKGMSGVELARRARSIDPGLGVLLTSGYPEEVFQHHGRPEEGTALLRKPYRRRDLAEAVRQALAERRSGAMP